MPLSKLSVLPLPDPNDIAVTDINSDDNLPAGAIATRMGAIRKKAAALGLTPSNEAPAYAKPLSGGPPGGKSSAGAARGPKATVKKRKAGGILNNDSESATHSSPSNPRLCSQTPTDFNSDDDKSASSSSEQDKKRFRTAPATPNRQLFIAGQVTKPRVSPRGLPKKDYKALEDPFNGNGTLDADGNQIFDESTLEDEEDGSDDDYAKKESEEGKGAEEVEVVKTEDVEA